MNNQYSVVYVTSSEHKKKEFEIIKENLKLIDGTSVKDLPLNIETHKLSIRETLEVSVVELVREEVFSAYQKIHIPCIVEHAGLIFNDIGDQYPGGLTKPMWNALGDKFTSETHSDKRKVTARAVIAYCDGMKIYTFTGETKGVLVYPPRGNHDFYWDTIFVPQDDNPENLTYAEIIEKKGIINKVMQYSQSQKAFLKFFEFIHKENIPSLWL